MTDGKTKPRDATLDDLIRAGKIQTYDDSVRIAAARLAWNPVSTQAERDAFAKTLERSVQTTASYFLDPMED